ncbi:MAG TPA: TIGR01459 family HAD-type hydrolase [Xanthobacteraceae bacterium]|nr:TIGR01459 family HAD-type hydrolase [Xanthobacteraceae bacterium]
MTDFIERIEPLARGYDVLLCDIWGVVHNGVAAFPEACDALSRFRSGGGTVILVTNAPRASEAVVRILDRMNVAHAVYDAIVSSGDVTRGIVARRSAQRVFHLGPERDHSIFAGLEVTFAPLEAADYVVCSGLFDDTIETPDNYRDMLAAMRRRALFMVCANPDVVVERGDTLVYCAGALADAYAALGGDVLYCGKPHAPIYDMALATAASLRGGRIPSRDRVLAIGDSVRTDLKGAAAFGLDVMFVTSGLHAEHYGSRDAPDMQALNKVFADAGVAPKAVMSGLKW